MTIEIDDMDSSSMTGWLMVLLLLVGWIAITVALHTSLREPARPPVTRAGDDTAHQTPRLRAVLDQRPHVRAAPTGSINTRSQPLVRRPRGTHPRVD